MKDYIVKAPKERSISFGERVAEKKKTKDMKEIVASRQPLSYDPDKVLPIAIQVEDHTRIGLEVNVYKKSRVLCVSISLPNKDMNVDYHPMNRVKIRDDSENKKINHEG